MRKILINYKTWLLIIVFSSIYLIIGVDLEYVPLIPSTLSLDEINRLNSVFLAMSYSILAAYIFFFFSIVLPRIILIERSKKILGQQVHWLLYELFVTINQILHAYDIDNLIEEIEEKDLLHINGNIRMKYSSYYSTSEHWRTFGKKGKKFTGFGNMSFTFPDSMIVSLNKIPDLIDQIRKSNPNFHVDEYFSEILSSIETNKLIDWYGIKKNNVFLFANTSEEIYSLIIDYKRLKKVKYHLRFRNSYSTLHFYTEQEIENINPKNAEFIARLAPIRKRIDSLNPCIIFNPVYKDSRAFKSILRIRNIHSFDYKKNRTLVHPNNKCVIILPVGIPNKLIKNYIKENKSEKLIILLKPNFILTTKSDKFEKIDVNSGLYKLYYRIPIKLFNITLFRDYPTKTTLNNINKNIYNLTKNHKIEK